MMATDLTAWLAFITLLKSELFHYMHEEQNEMNEAARLFEETLTWMLNTFASHRFVKERDIEWTLYKYLRDRVENQGLPYRISDGCFV